RASGAPLAKASGGPPNRVNPNGKVLGEVDHPVGATDFSSYLLNAQASNAKVIGLADAGQDAINAIKSAGEFGIASFLREAHIALAFEFEHAGRRINGNGHFGCAAPVCL
ncbi:MAG: ABC transporter substrate-binding protein, partial [Janthinobacterium lividum]